MAIVQIVSVFAKVIYFVLAKSLKLIIFSLEVSCFKGTTSKMTTSVFLKAIWMQIKRWKVIFVALLFGQEQTSLRWGRTEKGSLDMK